jgi:hypothetical protein|nr:MAG TPA: hypothetical protein [Caudoviricetes sp.]
MGAIIDGIYYRETPKDEAQRVSSTVTGIADTNNKDRQREDYAVDLIQSRNPDGTVNEDFIEYYPEEAKKRGLI